MDFIAETNRLLNRITEIENHFKIVWESDPDKPFTGYDGQEGILYFNNGFKLNIGGVYKIIDGKCINTPTDIKKNTIAGIEFVKKPLTEIINLINIIQQTEAQNHEYIQSII